MRTHTRAVAGASLAIGDAIMTGNDPYIAMDEFTGQGDGLLATDD